VNKEFVLEKTTPRSLGTSLCGRSPVDIGALIAGLNSSSSHFLLWLDIPTTCPRYLCERIGRDGLSIFIGEELRPG